MKVGVTPDLDCLGSYSQPWGGGHTDPGFDWQGNNQNIETKINSNDWGLTCSYKFQVTDKSFIKTIGGVSYQKVFGFKRRMVLAPEAINGLFARQGVPFQRARRGL